MHLDNQQLPGSEGFRPGVARKRLTSLILVAIVSGVTASGIVYFAFRDRGPDPLSGSSNGPSSVSSMVEAARRSVVTLEAVIETYEGSVKFCGKCTGTGIVLTEDGFVATNAHLVTGATSIDVTLPDGSRISATVVGVNVAADLAVLRIDRAGLKPIALGRSGNLKVGDPVIAIGNALALDGGPSATLGIVSALERKVATSGFNGLEHLIQTDAAINDGNSGGPLVDGSGMLVGIVAGRSAVADDIGFAIPIDLALPILETLASRSFQR